MINPCDIENDLISQLAGCGYSVFNATPTTCPANNIPFITVNADNTIVDMNGYYITTININIFVYNNGGLKNDKKTGLVLSAIKTKLPFKSDLADYDPLPSILPMGKTTDGYFVNTIQVQTIIKK